MGICQGSAQIRVCGGCFRGPIRVLTVGCLRVCSRAPPDVVSLMPLINFPPMGAQTYPGKGLSLSWLIFALNEELKSTVCSLLYVTTIWQDSKNNRHPDPPPIISHSHALWPIKKLETDRTSPPLPCLWIPTWKDLTCITHTTPPMQQPPPPPLLEDSISSTSPITKMTRNPSSPNRIARLSLREDSLVFFTDGSQWDCRSTSYGLVGYHMNSEVCKLRVPFAKKASQWDAKMDALAHTSHSLNHFLKTHPRITWVQMFLDVSSAIQKIFNGSPHPSQTASILFHMNFLKIFTRDPAIKVTITWTSGHKGTAGMKRVNGLAKKASKMTTCGHPTLVLFTSRSAAEQNVDRKALKCWKMTIESDPIEECSESHLASLVLCPSLHPQPWFKKLTCPEMSHLTQFVSGHSYTGEYYKDFIKANNTCCPSCTDLSQTWRLVRPLYPSYQCVHGTP